MDSVDFQAREKALKGLIIAFIIGILIVNFSLLLKIFHNAGGLSQLLKSCRGCRLQTLVSLAIGDILVAFFSLMVMARLLFEIDAEHEVSCRTKVLSSTYFNEIMPLVYGTGLMVMVIESAVFRDQKHLPIPRDNNTDQAMKSLGVGALPWVLGILVGLPLSISHFDFGICMFKEELSIHRQRAMRVVCLILPSLLALFAALCYMCSRLNTPESSPAAHSQPVTGYPISSSVPGTTVVVPAAPALQHYPIRAFSGSAPSCDEAQQQLFGIPRQGSATFALHEQFKEGKSSCSNTGYAVNPSEGYPGNQDQFASPYLCNAPTDAGVGTPNSVAIVASSSLAFSPAGHVPQRLPGPTLDIYYHDSERNVLLRASFLVCICTLPKAFFELCYSLDENKTSDLSELQQVALGDLVFWLLVLRSFLLPLIWVLSGTQAMPRPEQQSS